MYSLAQDIRHGLRMLLRSPGFAAIAVLTLALGIGANTAIFSVINAVVLRPLPFEAPERLVMVKEVGAAGENSRGLVSYPNFVDWRQQNQVFEDIAVLRSESFTLTGADAPERIRGARVSASLFNLLRVKLTLGRTFLPEEDQVGGERVVVLSDELWRRRFGADPDVLGQTLTMDGEPFRIVGVLPPGFRCPVVVSQAQVWTSATLVEQQFLESRGGHTFRVLARLKPGVSIEQASADMDTIARRLELQYPDTNAECGVRLVPLHEQVVGAVRPALAMLLGAVTLVLLIACANVANLLLTQCAGRSREFAVRAALGGGRRRLVRQLLTESALVGVLGGLLGVVLAAWCVDVASALLPPDLPRAEEIGLDARVLAFALILSLATSLVFGLAPALQAARVDLSAQLKEGGRGSATRSRGLLRSSLIVGEVALTLVLLIGAGLLTRSFHRVMRVEPGFESENVLTFDFAVPQSHDLSSSERARLYEEVRARVENVPGVASACVNVTLPLTERAIGLVFRVEGQPEAETEPLEALYGSISPNYFSTMGIPLLQGRTFTERDTRDGAGVMIVNATMARRFWSNNDAIGQRLRTSISFPGVEPDSFEIVGIVADVRESLFDEPEPYMYVPFQQQTWPMTCFALRITGDPATITSTVRQELAAIVPDIVPSGFKTLSQYVADTVAQRRFATIALSAYALIALALAIVGLYGTLSHMTAQRTREIGVRMALGAQRVDVIRLVLRQGVLLTGIGLAGGLLGAFAATRVLSSLLFGITAVDPTTFGGVAVLLAIVATLACYIPARRATRVDPVVALRSE